jgi:hypothetical protein
MERRLYGGRAGRRPHGPSTIESLFDGSHPHRFRDGEEPLAENFTG